MKFLLVAINAKYIHSNPAIYSLRAYAGEALQRHVELAEYTINQQMQEILGDLYGRKPDAIGFSCYIWNWRLIRELLGELPKLLPGTALWLGGPEVSYDADVILRRFPQVTGIMVGEGEATFRELLQYYMGRTCPAAGDDTPEEDCSVPGTSGVPAPKGSGAPGKLEEISGLCLPSGYTPCRALTDMSDIPFLYSDLGPFENRMIYYETSRGCPFRCSYCLSSIEKRVRFRDINVIKNELQFFLDHRVKQVKFVDRTFNCNHEHAWAVWQFILEHDNGVTNFHFEISADLLREEEIALLSRFRPGLAQLEIGVQSTNGETLRAIRRTAELNRLEEAVRAIHRAGNIHLHLDLIAGLPWEDYESFGRSFDRVYRMEPEQLQLGFLKVLKGSEIWERAGEYGIAYLEEPPYEVLYTKSLSYGEVLRLKRVEEMVELYYNSGQFTHTLPFLERAFPGPFAMYEAMADFYRRKGCFTSSPARSYRYRVLLEFAGEYDGERREIYRELLTYDMYLRENLKSRPEFALELSGYKEDIRDFYKREERERAYLPDYGDCDWKQLARMTHLEPFSYPVWDRKKMAEGYEAWGGKNPAGEDGPGREIKAFVLFDYRKRNPLNNGAGIKVSTCSGNPLEYAGGV